MITHWIHQYGPELNERIRHRLKPTNDSWRVDETYVKVKRQWMYLYLAVDSEGNTIDFHLSKTRNHRAAKRFFKKALRSFHISNICVLTVDKKNPAYLVSIEELKNEKKMPLGIQLKQLKYLNNMVEQNHIIEKRVRSMLELQSFGTAIFILSGIEVINLNYWILKVGKQNIYKDTLGKEYIFDNTHSIKLKSGDYFIYLSTLKSRYEFIGYGKIESLETRRPKGNEVRNAKVKAIYIASLSDLCWFGEGLDFSVEKGQLNRSAVGISKVLNWGRSIIKLDEELFRRIINLAQPGDSSSRPPLESIVKKGSPGRKWSKIRKVSEAIDVLNSIEDKEFEPNSFEDARKKAFRSIAQRQGQTKFRKDLLEAYESKCAITNCDVERALQAAHIYPYRGKETNIVTNGLLLRSDIHDLFDLGLITIDTTDMSVRLHDSISTSSYGKLQGKPLRLPKRRELQPNKTYLEYHSSFWIK